MERSDVAVLNCSEKTQKVWMLGLGKTRRGFVTGLGMEDRCEGEASPDAGSPPETANCA
jgi:hypothetical protein